MVNHYFTHGSGETRVLVLNGWFGSSGAWGALIPNLNGTDFTWAFMDYRGYGGSKDVAGEHTLAEISSDALAVADDLGWDTFSLVGHSMGGQFIQRILVDAPQRVERLVALTPVPASGVPLDDEGHALFHGAVENRDNRYGIVDFTTGNRNTPVWVNAVVDHSLANSTREAFGDYLDQWTTVDFHEEVVGNEVPILAVVGEHDPALSAEVISATFLEWYPNATMEIMTNAGHYPMDETPVQLATVMERFLTP